MSRKDPLTTMLEQRPLQRETLGSQIYRALRSAILQQTYEGGERLTQEELASSFGTSRIPVRDALRMLETDGLVVADGSGYSVVKFGPEDILEIYAIRALLEPYAASIAAEKLGQEQLQRIVEHTRNMAASAKAGDFEEYARENAELHLALYEASQRPCLVRIIEGLWIGRPPLTPLQVPSQAERSVREHEELLEALMTRDGERVGKLVEAHIMNARDALLAYYAREESANS